MRRRCSPTDVILSAGAIGSPVILLRSGIGPAADLAALGIPVVHDAPGVGANLHDHLLSPVIFTTRRPVGPPQPGVSVTQTHLSGEAATIWQSRHAADPLLRAHVGASSDPRGDDGFTLMAGLVTPQSRGRLTLSGPGLADPPLSISPRSRTIGTWPRWPHPCVSAVASARVLRWARSGGRSRRIPVPRVADDQVEDWVRRTAITYHHQVGTCRMGSDPEAVVDARLRVQGVEGLHVMDASVIPTVPTATRTHRPR